MNQHIKLKHPEFYQQMSANNPNLVMGSKRGDSSINDGGSHLGRDDSYINDDESEEESESEDHNKGHR